MTTLESRVAALERLLGADLVTRTEAARLLGVSPSTFDRLRARGVIPAPSAGTQRAPRWRRADLVREA